MTDLSLAQQAKVQLSLSTLIPPSPLSFLVVTLYFAAEIDIPSLQNPVVFITPQPFDPDSISWRFGHRNTFWQGTIMSAKQVRFLFAIEVLETLPMVQPGTGTDFTKFIHRFNDWQWYFKDHPQDAWEPYPAKRIRVTPQYVILLTPFSSDSTSNDEPRKYSFFESFFTEAKPTIFLVYHNSSGQDLLTNLQGYTSETPKMQLASNETAPQGYQRSNFAGYMVNWVCRFHSKTPASRANPESPSIKGLVSVWWFRCPLNQHCWSTLLESSISACDHGKLVIWSQYEKVKLESAEPTLQPAWKQLEPMQTIRQVLFPIINATDALSSRLDSEGMLPENSLYLYYSKEVTKVSEPVVFVTTEQVVFERSGFQMYVEIFDGSIWITLLVSILICSVGLASRIEPWSSTSSSSSSCFWKSLRWFVNLALSLIDQLLGFGTTNHRTLLSAWLLSLLVLNNWYKAEIKSSFAFNFPYETKLKSWRDFENLSLYTIQDDGPNCDSRIHNSFLHDINSLVYYVLWESSDDRLLQNVPWTDSAPLKHRPQPRRHHYTVDNAIGWLNDQIVGKEKRAELATSSEKEKEECRQDVEVLYRMHSHIDYICFNEFHDYAGHQYRSNVEEAREIMKKPLREWDLVIQDALFKRPTDETNFLLYWMSRKHESAFVFSPLEFAYYWNMFKQLMKTTGLRFAHTEINYPTDESGIHVPQLSSMHDMQLRGPSYGYPPPAKWMLDRMKALTTSGLTRWYQKWELILNPLRKYPRRDEVPVGTVGAKAVSVADDSFVSVLKLWAIGLAVSVIMGVLEHVVAICT